MMTIRFVHSASSTSPVEIPSDRARARFLHSDLPSSESGPSHIRHRHFKHRSALRLFPEHPLRRGVTFWPLPVYQRVLLPCIRCSLVGVLPEYPLP